VAVIGVRAVARLSDEGKILVHETVTIVVYAIAKVLGRNLGHALLPAPPRQAHSVAGAGTEFVGPLTVLPAIHVRLSTEATPIVRLAKKHL
jgi:hypothetical protein